MMVCIPAYQVTNEIEKTHGQCFAFKLAIGNNIITSREVRAEYLQHCWKNSKGTKNTWVYLKLLKM